MSRIINRIALAISAGAFLLAAPLAQADGEDAYNPKKADKFNEKLAGATPGGVLYVADPTQPVTITLLDDDSLFHLTHDFYWYDYDTSNWVKYDLEDYGVATLNGQTLTITPTTDQVAFAVGIKDKVGQVGYYIFGTGDGSLDTASNLKDPTDVKYLGDPHSVVYYDYTGPANVTKEANVALVGFEDTVTFFLSDYDDVIFTVGNIASHAPEPEAYAMLLAGLGLVGAATRRRRMAEKA
ncbi:MAG: PEP-CTERM sorting domain-containing protein [Azoarcus sp.]|nr:PEP-CTERM sorting domain-containing protein [Azoarcus sp.]